MTFLALFIISAVMLVTVNYLVLVRLTQPPTSPPTAEQLESVGIVAGSGGLASPQSLEQLFETSPEAFFARVRDQARAEVLRHLITSSVLAVAAAAFIAWFIGGRFARTALGPVREITTVARQLSVDNLHERIGHEGPADELSELADTFDGMLGRLEAAFDAHRSFGSYVSHELLTPLSSLRAEAELTIADPMSPTEAIGLAQIAIRQVDRSNELITGLLAVSRAEAGLHDVVEVDIAEIVGDVVGELVHVADEHHLNLDLDFAGPPGAFVTRGDGPLLAALVRNLVRNAAQYNAPGGTIDVSLSAEDQSIVLRVDNTGPTLDAADIAVMAQPFRRLALTRNQGAGHGLGTAIVSAVATLHEGTATWSSRIGGGICAEVTIPVRPVTGDRPS